VGSNCLASARLTGCAKSLMLTPVKWIKAAHDWLVGDLTLKGCQSKLAGLWTFGLVLNLTICLMITAQPAYRDSNVESLTVARDIWIWSLRTIIPFLTTIVGALMYEMQQRQRGSRVNVTAFQVAFGLSVIYVILSAMATNSLGGHHPAEMVAMQGVWEIPLASVGGLVGLGVGAFFASSSPQGRPGRAPVPAPPGG
jgi:hypothetical protein